MKAAVIARLAVEEDAAPNVIKPVPTAPSPAVQDATGPNLFINFELMKAEPVKLTTARDVNVIPTAPVPNLSLFWRSEGKNAKNVLSAA